MEKPSNSTSEDRRKMNSYGTNKQKTRNCTQECIIESHSEIDNAKHNKTNEENKTKHKRKETATKWTNKTPKRKGQKSQKQIKGDLSSEVEEREEEN